MKVIQVVVSSPFRGKNHWEIHQSCALAEAIAAKVVQLNDASLRLGTLVHPSLMVHPICAHTNSRHFLGLASDAYWLEVYSDLITRCDALLLCGEWEASAGCAHEIAIAKFHNIPIFHTIEGLQAWVLEKNATLIYRPDDYDSV